jgi:hypothetical protein
MRRFLVLVSLVAATGLLASCALIPPIGIGADALGIEATPVEVQFAQPLTTGFTVQAVTGKKVVPDSFDDVEPPSLPITPSSLLMEQGFASTVTVTSAQFPDTITITDASELSVTVSEQDPDGPEPVNVTIPFGPLVLEKDAACSTSPCAYTFSDEEAAATALDGSISGAKLSRLIEIVSSGGTNDLELVLSLTVESEPDFSGTMKLTIDVVENYIKF